MNPWDIPALIDRAATAAAMLVIAGLVPAAVAVWIIVCKLGSL